MGEIESLFELGLEGGRGVVAKVAAEAEQAGEAEHGQLDDPV